MIKILKREQAHLNEMLEYMEKEIETLPHGKLYSQKHGKEYQYYVDDKYLRRSQQDIAEGICVGSYYKRVSTQIKRKLYWLDGLIKTFESNNSNDIYNGFNYGKQILLSNLKYKSPSQIIDEFNKQQYSDNTSFLELHPIETGIYTNNGEQVRSKSEKIIADALQNKGIPYKYEIPLSLMKNNKKITIHPDFTVLNVRTAKKFYIEHLGMMSDEEYFIKAVNKIMLYEKNNILQGRDLIVFYESEFQPLNTAVLNEYINEFFT